MTAKICLITGAGSGIGAATAHLMAGKGYHIVLADIDAQAIDHVAATITAGGGVARPFSLDVSDEAQWIAVLGQIGETIGPIDILVNNAAAFGLGTPLTDTSLSDWRRVTSVSLDGLFLGMKHAIPIIAGKGGGAIVNISSILGKVGTVGAAAYVASKGAVTTLTKAAALECAQARNGVRINSVHPGFVSTPALHSRLEGPVLDAVIGMHPMGRLATAEEVAEAIAFLASDASSFCTGTELYVDGGYTAQ